MSYSLFLQRKRNKQSSPVMTGSFDQERGAISAVTSVVLSVRMTSLSSRWCVFKEPAQIQSKEMISNRTFKTVAWTGQGLHFVGQRKLSKLSSLAKHVN